MSPIAHNLAATPRTVPWHCRNCRPMLASRDPAHKVDIKSCARNCAPSITTRMLTQLRVVAAGFPARLAPLRFAGCGFRNPQESCAQRMRSC
jgi:hypothetical protein